MFTEERGGRETARTRQGKLVFSFYKQPQSLCSVTHWQQLTSWHGIWYQTRKWPWGLATAEKNPVIFPSSILYRSEMLKARPECLWGKNPKLQCISNSVSKGCIPLFWLAVFTQKTKAACPARWHRVPQLLSWQSGWLWRDSSMDSQLHTDMQDGNSWGIWSGQIKTWI